MADFVVDSFTDTAGTDLQDHSPDTGSAWVRQTGVNTLGIDANGRLAHKAEFSTQRYYNSETPPAQDYGVQATINKGNSTNSESIMGIAARMSSSADTCFRFSYAAGTGFVLVRNSSGTGTTLDTYAYAMTNGESLIMKMTCQEESGSTRVKCYLDGDEIINELATTLSTGFAGVRGFRCYTAALTLDNFSAFTLDPLPFQPAWARGSNIMIPGAGGGLMG